MMMTAKAKRVVLWTMGLALSTYVVAYFATTRLEDRKQTKGVFGGLAGQRYSRHFETETRCLAFLPLLWIERPLRAGRLDVTFESGEYNMIYWVF